MYILKNIIKIKIKFEDRNKKLQTCEAQVFPIVLCSPCVNNYKAPMDIVKNKHFLDIYCIKNKICAEWDYKCILLRVSLCVACFWGFCLRFFIIFLLNILSYFLHLFLCFWKLIFQAHTNIYINLYIIKWFYNSISSCSIAWIFFFFEVIFHTH